MGYKLGKTSLDRLNTCEEDLQKIISEAIKLTPIDFGVAEGHRSIEKQNQLFEEGKSRIDGINRKGKHNFFPSQAVDVFAFVNGRASWDQKTLCLIAGVIIATSERLYQSGEISHRLRWGGNWDGDGVMISDQGFVDLPHFELLK